MLVAFLPQVSCQWEFNFIIWQVFVFLSQNTLCFYSSQKDCFKIRILVQQRSPTEYNHPPSQIMKAPNKLSHFLAVSVSCADRLALIRWGDSCSSSYGWTIFAGHLMKSFHKLSLWGVFKSWEARCRARLWAGAFSVVPIPSPTSAARGWPHLSFVSNYYLLVTGISRGAGSRH